MATGARVSSLSKASGASGPALYAGVDADIAVVSGVAGSYALNRVEVEVGDAADIGATLAIGGGGDAGEALS